MSNPPVVYFIQDEADGSIKIGTTTVGAGERLVELRSLTKRPLVLLATTPGGPEVERGLHMCFEALRIQGEWFRPEPPLLAFVATARASAEQRAAAPPSAAVSMLGESMFCRLVALADAYQAAHGLSDGEMADRAGLMRESYVRARKKGRDGKGDVETLTAEKIARAIACELVLVPKDKVAAVNRLLEEKGDAS